MNSSVICAVGGDESSGDEDQASYVNDQRVWSMASLLQELNRAALYTSSCAPMMDVLPYR